MSKVTWRKNGKERGALTLRDRAITTIGRHFANDVFLADDEKISRFHAAIIENENGDYFIRDLGSKHGIMVNGKRCYRKMIQCGDIIQLCETDYEIELEKIEEGRSETWRREHREGKKVGIGNKPQPVESSAYSSLQRVKRTIGPTFLDENIPPDVKEKILSIRTALLAIHDLGPFMKQYLRMVCAMLMKPKWSWIALLHEKEELEVIHEVNTPDNLEPWIEENPYITVMKQKRCQFFETSNGVRVACMPLQDDQGIIGLAYFFDLQEDSCSEGIRKALDGLVEDEELARHISQHLRKRPEKLSEVKGFFKWKEKFVGNIRTESMQLCVYNKIRSFGNSMCRILICGETGVGKTELARKIHILSDRKGKELVKARLVSTTPVEIIHSELFGHVKGAFTDAKEDKRGRFEEANGSTLFMDEIAMYPRGTQETLVEALEKSSNKPITIRRLGDTKAIQVDVRVLSATNEEIWAKVEKGEFREDLYHRLAEEVITIPPLRERKEDIPLIVNFFIDELSDEVEGISREAIEVLIEYDWPGNIRKLQSELNKVIHEVASAGGKIIGLSDLPEGLVRTVREKIKKEEAGQDMSQEDRLNLSCVEKEHILKVVKQTGWNKKKALELLGLTRPTLLDRLKEYACELLWENLGERRLEGLEFMKQEKIGKFYFLCPEKKTAIIVTALGSGRTDEDEDSKRAERLESEGYRVLKFESDRVLKNVHETLETIRQVCFSGKSVGESKDDSIEK
jgi:DNA-binding NtrC family response regulator